MYEIVPSNYFLKKFKKITKTNEQLFEKVATALENLKNNPRHTTLHTHKVNTSKFGQLWSSRVSGDIRILWEFDEDKKVIEIHLLDIGGHEGGNSVYL